MTQMLSKHQQQPKYNFLYVLVISGEYVSEFKDKTSANNEGNLYFKVNIKGFEHLPIRD
jgi:hypothetical protein